MSGPPSSSTAASTTSSIGRFLSLGVSCRPEMTLPPRSHRLSRCLRNVLRDNFKLRVCPKSLSRITELSQHKPDGGQSKESQCIAVEILKIFGKAPAAIGRVGDWRAGLGRCLCSPLARPFVCECHKISTMPRFQPPPHRTQRANFWHYAHLFASPQSLWDLSCRDSFPRSSTHPIVIE